MERRKKTRRLFSLLLAMSSLLVASGVSASKPGYEPAYVKRGGSNVPFKGTLQGHESDSQFSKGPPPTIVVTTSGTGIGTHLGEFSFAQEVTVNLAAVTDTGSAHWVAANGDSIDVTIVGSGEPMATPDGVVFSITEICTITGGTGRFAGAQGSFTVERVANPKTLFAFGSLHGTITSPGAE